MENYMQKVMIKKCLVYMVNNIFLFILLNCNSNDYSLVIAPVVAELCTTSVALSAPPNSYQNNSQS